MEFVARESGHQPSNFYTEEQPATKTCSTRAMKPTGLGLAVRKKFPNMKMRNN